MDNITVNLKIASELSKKMSQTASAFNRHTVHIAMNGKSTTIGNTHAIQTIQRFNQSRKQLSDLLTRDGNCLHSVAEEFAAIDQKLANNTCQIDTIAPLYKGDAQ